MSPPRPPTHYALLLWGFVYASAALNAWASTWLQRREKGGVWGLDASVRGSGAYWRRRLPVVAQALTVPLVLLVPAHERDMRAVVALASAFYFIKTAEQALDDDFQAESTFHRIVGIIGTFHDVRERKPAHPLWGPFLTKDLIPEMVWFARDVAGCLASMWVVDHRREVARGILERVGVLHHHPNDEDQLVVAVACVGACWYAFFALCVYGEGLALVWLLLARYRFPPLMNSPWKARSVSDFWIRWDVVIQKLLRVYCYTPLRARGAPAIFAIFTTFLLSGWVHVYPIFVGLGLDVDAAVRMMSYFFVQFFFIALERPLGVAHWSPMAARAWTLACLFGPSYNLCVPVFKLVGVELP